MISSTFLNVDSRQINLYSNFYNIFYSGAILFKREKDVKMNNKNFTSDLVQPIGESIPNWTSRKFPPHIRMEGRYCFINILDVAKHGEDLFSAFAKDIKNQDWTYLPYGPFETQKQFIDWLQNECTGNDPLFHAIIDRNNNKPIGMVSYLRINNKDGVIEVGHIHYSILMQKKTIGTEVMYLMMKRVFDELKYRRYEWKCNALNIRSCESALRLGFKFEGISKQHVISKNRNRDTSWFAIIDKDWPRVKENFKKWLDKNNFNEDGIQKVSLSSLM